MSAFLLANSRPAPEAARDGEALTMLETACAEHGGQILVWGGSAEPVAGAELPLDHVVMAEFDTPEAVRAFAGSRAGREGLLAHPGELAAVLLHGADVGEPRARPAEPGYVLADTVISRPQVHLEGWLPRGRPLHRSHGGRIIGVSSPRTLSRDVEDLSRPEAPESLAGRWDLGRVLLNEFPSLASARAFVTSEGFVEGGRVRAEAGRYRFAVLRGRALTASTGR